MKYRIFQHTIESDIPLPELPEESIDSAILFFQSKQYKEQLLHPIHSPHHWYLPNGQISFSVAKQEDGFWIDFPNIAIFSVNTDSGHIISYRKNHIPNESIRHLLLDQVIPRLLSHRGEQIVHASSIVTEYGAIAFCGESGWGKSTLAAFFHGSSGSCSLLTDDCLSLHLKNNKIYCIASYPGIRLFEDSLSLLLKNENVIPVAHYSNKKRLLMKCSSCQIEEPISAIFMLNDPSRSQKEHGISINKISGAAASIALLKHTFPLDITDKSFIKKQLQDLAVIGGNKSFDIFDLSFKRDHTMLHVVKEAILSKLSSNYSNSQ